VRGGRIEDVHSPTVQRRIERACLQAKAADREVITEVVAENIELDEPHSFAVDMMPPCAC
jgi:hypothetical protein